MSMPEAISLDNPFAIIGEEDAVLGFKALGFNPYPLKDAKELRGIMDEIIRANTAICLIQDNIYETAKSEIARYSNLALPIFIPFSKSAKLDLLDEAIKAIRLRATGKF